MTRKGKKDFKNPEMMLKPFIIMGSIFVYIFCMERIGFFVSSAIYMPCGMLLFGQRKPLRIILSTAGVLAFIYFFFIFQLNVRMPRGFLF
jgi:hypothetical protein